MASSALRTRIRRLGEFATERLEAWLSAHVAGYRGPLAIERFAGGQSNPTYRLVTPARSYVLRRKPVGVLLPGAHAIEREYRVVTALGAQGFPVARLHGLCLDEDVIGTPFYVMDLVEGRIFWDTALPGESPMGRAACFAAMNATLARLHSFDPAELGLADFGRPGSYFERQIARWSKQYLADAEAGRLDAMDRLIAWLGANIPPDDDDQACIIHGDYRCDNFVFHPTEPRIVAVLDWELSTLGHPLADFTYHLMIYRMPPGPFTGLAGLDLTALGIPSEAAYIAAYCANTGRQGIAHLDFYMAFNMFRLAAIVHGIKGRLIRGNAASPSAAAAVAGLPDLANLAWRQTGD